MVFLFRRVRVLLRVWRRHWQTTRAATLRLFLRLVPGERQRVFALTLLIGALCGLAAVAFHLAIQTAEHQLIDRALAAPGRSWIGWTIVTPMLGGLVSGLLLYYVVPDGCLPHHTGGSVQHRPY